MQSLVLTLSKDFLMLVMIAFVLATTGFRLGRVTGCNHLHTGFKISWWIYVLAGLMSFLIAIVTLSFQAIKLAISNPVQ